MGDHRIFQGRFRGVSRVLHWCFKGVSRELEGFKGCLWFKYFKPISHGCSSLKPKAIIDIELVLL